MFRPRMLPCLDCWYWQGFRIRCALSPDEPRQLEQHWALGCKLVEHGLLSPWRMSRLTFDLLLDTAGDPVLPWHWRNLCLNNAYRSLHVMEHLADGAAQRQMLNGLRNRLATLHMPPSLALSELAEGNPYE